MFKAHHPQQPPNSPSGQSIRSKNEDLKVLDSLRYWDVTMPPVRKYMVGGHLVPGVKNFLSEVSMGTLNKKRRITIELYKKVDERDYHLYRDRKTQQVFLEGFEASQNDVSTPQSGKKKLQKKKFVLEDDDVLIFRIMKPIAAGSLQDRHDDDEDDRSVATELGGIDNHYMTTFALDNYGDGYDLENTRVKWKERYRATLQTMEILKVHSRTVEIQMGISDDTIIRDFSFDSIRDANTFVDIFNECGRLQRERGLRQAAAHGSQLKLQIPVDDSDDEERPVVSRGLDLFNEEENAGENVAAVKTESKKSSCCGCLQKPKKVYPSNLNVLIEVVSASNLPIGDIFSSDPYVLILDGNKELHRTGYLPTTLNPVWTLATGSLCLLQTTLTSFFENSSYMEFFVKDYDSIGEHEILGTVMVPKKTILEGEGEREEFELSQFAGKNNVLASRNKKSTLALRFKLATEDDVKFMLEFEANKRKGFFRQIRGVASRVAGTYAGSEIAARVAGEEIGVGLYSENSYLPLRSHPNPAIKRNQRSTPDKKSVEYRVKPFPDPDRPIEETKWMTERQIEHEAYKPSTQWIEAGTGSVGKYFVEIIGCDGLPNMDFSVTGRDKTDSFCTIVYEDCIVNTDVINDCLSPRFMPWTQRAFIFNVMHPSSQIHVAVLDYDDFIPGVSSGPAGKHDKIGRVIINPTNFRPNAIHTMRYHIFSSDEPDRKIVGTLIIRCRYESKDERQILLSQLQLQMNYSVSTVSRSDYRCTYYAVANDRRHQTLNLSTLTGYVEELKQYSEYLDEIADAMLTLFMWRGTYPVTIKCCKWKCSFKVPVHSIIAFMWGIILANDFEKIFSFLCFWVGWVLLATLEFRRSHPNPWKRPRAYAELLGILVLNKSFVEVKVQPNQNIDEIIKYDEILEERERMRIEALENMRIEKENNEKRLQAEGEEMDKQASEEKTTVTGGFTNLALAPFKPVLLPAQLALYRVCVILRVGSSIVMWRDSVAAFWITTAAFLASLAVAWIPWAFLFRWAFKIFVYVVLGPWMKLVDIFYVNKVQNMTMAERKAKIEADYQRRYNLLLGESYIRKLLKERAMKLMDMQRYMFGEYLVNVPIYKTERYPAIPLSGGSVEPFDAKDAPPVNVAKHVDGQLLIGDMVPKRENSQAEAARRQEAAAESSAKTEFDLPDEPPILRRNGELAPLMEGHEVEYGAAYC